MALTNIQYVHKIVGPLEGRVGNGTAVKNETTGVDVIPALIASDVRADPAN